MSQLPILKLGKQWINKQLYRTTIFIGDKQYRMPEPVGAVWSDIILASKEKAFARGNMVVNVRGDLYRVGEKVAKPLKIKKNEFVKKIDFLDSPTAWLVYPSQALYADPKTRTSDDLL